MPAIEQDCFHYPVVVHFDELDAMQLVHNARYALYIERAIIGFYQTNGWNWELDVAANPDQFHAVRHFEIEYLTPAVGVQPLEVRLWVERFGATSCTYGFAITSADGTVMHARGQRTIVRLNPATLRPEPWSDGFRANHQVLVKMAA